MIYRPEELKRFCELDCDRYEFLIHWLTREEISHQVIQTGNQKHIIVRLDKNRPYVRNEYIKTLVAHYDRVPGTPGANDNGAAVFQLLGSIERLKALKYSHNIQIIFTDGEELAANQAISDQGSFSLARLFREKGISNCLFLVFDMCGRGDTLVAGRAGNELVRQKTKTDKRFLPLYREMENFQEKFSDLFLSFDEGEFFYLSSLFSDDLGLLLNHYPALQISTLPYREILVMKEKLRAVDEKDWKSMEEAGFLSKKYRDFISSTLPPAWMGNHSHNDSIETLDPESFNLIGTLIDHLAKTPIYLRGVK